MKSFKNNDVPLLTNEEQIFFIQEQAQKKGKKIIVIGADPGKKNLLTLTFSTPYLGAMNANACINRVGQPHFLNIDEIAKHKKHSDVNEANAVSNSTPKKHLHAQSNNIQFDSGSFHHNNDNETSNNKQECHKEHEVHNVYKTNIKNETNSCTSNNTSNSFPNTNDPCCHSNANCIQLPKTFDPIFINDKQITNIHKNWEIKLKEPQDIIKKTNPQKHTLKLTENRNKILFNEIQKVSKKITKNIIKNINSRFNANEYELIFVMGVSTDKPPYFNMKTLNNQDFHKITFYILKEHLHTELNNNNITYLEQNESFTSKCSFLDNEALEEHKNYVGKRIDQQNFISSTGIYINADVNASFNIARKACGKLWNDNVVLDFDFNFIVKTVSS